MSDQISNISSSNNKRIAQNTIMLYIRMIVVTLVSLYTARLTLKLLGVEDYGINNVVGGLTGFMSIITGTMVSASQRFLAYDLGQNDEVQYQKTYSMLINLFICVSILGVCLLELVGPWFIYTHLVIPPDRMVAAQWIFQFAVLTFVLNCMTIPLTSSIIAYERMGIYAYFTFIDVFFKLLIVYALYVTPFDKLITVGALSLCMSLVTNGIYLYYCSKYLNGCKYKKFWDKTMFGKIGSYAGWNLFGSITSVMNQQGQAVLLNMFYGPVVNAAKAIADKVNQVIYSFCSNFYMAVTPQIIKNYASGNIEQTRKLVLSTSRYSYYLLWILSTPLIFCMEPILYLWLGKEQVSIEMVRFCQLVLVYSLVNVLEQPITQAVRATGDIKKYQIAIGSCTLTFIPLCYIMFKLKLPAYSSMILLSLIYAIAQIVRVKIVSPIIEITMFKYLKEVILPIILVSIIVIGLIFFADYLDANYILKATLYLIISISVVFIVGITNSEKSFVINAIKHKLKIGL